MAEQTRQLIDVINDAIDQTLSNLHTATIAKVVKVNEFTINCKPVINRDVGGESIELPEFLEVPPLFMQGGGSYTAHPVKSGDYCLLIITERCFDQWYEGKDNVNPPEFRLFDYSDAFAIVGVNPLAAAIAIPEVITHMGNSYAEGNHEQKGDVLQTGKFTLNGNLDQTGNMTVDGSFDTTGNNEAASYSVGGTSGVSGIFVEQGGKSLTIVNGIVTAIA